MPNVLVETRGGWLGAKRTAFLDAIQVATMEALRVPPHSLVLRLVVLVGQKKAVAIAVRNVAGRRRWSKLNEWLAATRREAK